VNKDFIHMNTAALRQAFLDYFQSKDHALVPSSPLIPANDPTLLFTNAGMVQFKEVFLGQDRRAYNRAASCQRCVRAGGKHNDLENVGYTARHHTFFEMLGNFSFGDYFKREAIRYAWEFITEVLKIPREKLWVTVFEEDGEAADIWLKEVGVDPARFSRCGAKDNFWSMGDTGPCGPCTEIFYDHGPSVAGGPPGSPEADGDRYVEIWNLVFMQYDRDASGKLTPLPKPSVDTGMGLERLAAVMQGVHSNYDIDLFRDLIRFIANLANVENLHNPSLRVIADHIRSCAFLVADGVIPSNEGRGYVLRRIIRRAIRHGHKLGLRDSFFYTLVEPLDRLMGEAHPGLRQAREIVEKVLRQEEERFAETLDHGMKLLDEVLQNLSGAVIPGEVIFKLYDTYGFPVDLTGDIARERDLRLDMDGFEREMALQRERARSASHFQLHLDNQEGADWATCFIGYEHLGGAELKVVALYRDNQPVDALSAGENGRVVLETTPFYAESGGQCGDRGVLKNASALFSVEDCKKLGKAHIHLGKLESGTIRVGDALSAQVDEQNRAAIARNHSATHLLHAALRRVLGEHVKQKGSLVQAERLRFDFAHFEPISGEQLQQIERLVNTQILLNSQAQTRIMSLDEAMNSGAMALFGEKYGDKVRVLSIGTFSTELCGGTHVRHAGDIGLFKILSEGGVAAGVRRIEAISGDGALDWVEKTDASLARLAALLKSDKDALEQRIVQLVEHARAKEKELERLQAKLASAQGNDLAGQTQEIKGVKLLAAKLEGADAKRLRETLDQIKNKLGSGIVVLGTAQGEKVSLIAGVTDDLTKRFKAGELVNFVASQVGGKGGGRPDMAQAGGNDPAALDGALRSVAGWVGEKA
jgi:alanyl-tRNA synthetase